MTKSRVIPKLALIVATTLSSYAGAAGIFTLNGKVHGFDDKTYRIATKNMIYTLKKSELSPEQLADLKAKKTGTDVELVVSTTAVASVVDKK